jgi:integrase/recombinase XerD
MVSSKRMDDSPRKPRRRHQPPPPGPLALRDTTLSLDAAIGMYLDHLRVARNLASSSVEAYGRDLAEFAKIVTRKARRHVAATEVTTEACAAYLVVVAKRVSARSQARRLSAVRTFFRFLAEMNLRADDPTKDLDSPRVGKRLPSVLTVKDVNELLSAPDRRTPTGERDGALLDLLYASGLRVSELADLRLGDLHLSEGYLTAVGKGRKQRLVPIGERARASLQKYIEGARELILAGGSRRQAKRRGRPPLALFVSRLGRRMSRQACWQVVTAAARTAGIRKKLSPHTLRHAFATHLVKRGADLRTVQMLLGHADIGTTEVYTHVTKTHVRKVHRKFHPRG